MIMKEKVIIQGMSCRLYGDKSAERIVFWFTGAHERDSVAGVCEHLWKHAGQEPFLMVICEVEHWNAQLSPWYAEAIYGTEDFAGKGKETLNWLQEACIPYLEQQYHILEKHGQLFIGGYSLAGLFALWAFYESDIFTGVAACSASLWFPHWAEYMREHTIHPGSLIYLSLGIKEEKTRNAVMATVGDATRSLYQQYCSDPRVAETVLEWNPGNHFTQPDERVFKGFAWLLDHNSRKNFGYKEYGKKRETNISAPEKRNAAYYESSR